MTTTVSFEVDDDTMAALRRVRRQKRSAGRPRQGTAELSDEDDDEIIAELLKDAYRAQVRREQIRAGSA